MIKAIIIEDEPEGRDYLKALLNQYSEEIDIVGESGSVLEGIQLINHHRPDLVFLDINVEGGSGFDILDTIMDPKPHVVFTTAYAQYALKAHKYNEVHDYLLKPIDLDDLTETMHRFQKRATLVEPTTQKVRLPISNGYRYVQMNEIIYIKGEGSYSRVYWSGNNELFLAVPLKHFENQLPEEGFIKTHKSFLVNKDRVEGFTRTEGYNLLLEEGHEVPVSRRLKEDVLKRL